jgi:hypothetical protein
MVPSALFRQQRNHAEFSSHFLYDRVAYTAVDMNWSMAQGRSRIMPVWLSCIWMCPGPGGSKDESFLSRADSDRTPFRRSMVEIVFLLGVRRLYIDCSENKEWVSKMAEIKKLQSRMRSDSSHD